MQIQPRETQGPDRRRNLRIHPALRHQDVPAQASGGQDQGRREDEWLAFAAGAGTIAAGVGSWATSVRSSAAGVLTRAAGVLTRAA